MSKNYASLEKFRENAKPDEEFVLVIKVNDERLSSVLGGIKSLTDLKEEDYKNLEFQIDYSGCYYEGDEPGIKLVYVQPKKI